MPADANIWLFSYGTLRQRNVQLATFGRELEGHDDALVGFSRSMVEIKDSDVVATSGETHHPILARSGNPADEVEGTVFRITPAEVAAADSYEVSDYKRVAVTLKSGIEAFVYIRAEG
ncbi:gamma-glutamylcyclotransferase [Bosea caraganae]|uniref:Gamma-glutamylcyclotransferase n=1 Tax=Bosea caraganae TaxID=2763117 RepID=A0A370L1U6_9HYPH|nr:gamma-glutamylcyclotransferase family protein [Bosea caraganae]RDJ21511.1 gamma-glutamylcyclotransferase [Bosea caraganae]RDJ23479.1 gamma-glutamylcyclotransferase [Bosea caraganae]